jgi:hypothetical protein
MKRIYYLIIVLLAFGCDNTSNPIKNSNSFRVEYEYFGEPNKFILSISGLTQGGQGWRFIDGEPTNLGFYDFGITHQVIMSKKPLVVETIHDIEKFTLQYNVIWIPTNLPPAEVIGRFKVYKNNTLIDTREYKVNHEQMGVATFEVEYQ